MLEEDKKDIVRKRIRVYGRVQGVGFRYLTMMTAPQLNLTGWVQNLADGSVLLEVQGKKDMVERLIPTVENGHWVRIDYIEEEWIDTVNSENSFRVQSK